MALLDRNFRSKCTPEIVTFERVADIHEGYPIKVFLSWLNLSLIEGEGDLRVEISESDLARNVFAKMGNLSCIYTVSLSPRTDRSSLEVVVFENPDKEDDIKKVFNFFRRNQVSPEPEVIPTKVLMFKGADTDTAYTLKVSLILNGQAIAVARRSLKALVSPATQAILDAQNTALAAQLSTRVNASRATSLHGID